MATPICHDTLQVGWWKSQHVRISQSVGGNVSRDILGRLFCQIVVRLNPRLDKSMRSVLLSSERSTTAVASAVAVLSVECRESAKASCRHPATFICC